MVLSLFLLAESCWGQLLSPSCSTTECHKPIKEFKSLHGPTKANGCTICHELGAGNLALPAKHPQLLPVKKGNTTCLVCHDDKTGAGFAHIHGAISEKGCTSCHNPHGSNAEHLLKAISVSEQCLSCHKELNTSSHAGHTKVLLENKACLTCHETHFANEKKLLKRAEKTTCLQCHDKEIAGSLHTIANLEKKVTEAYPHKPVLEGKCGDCHNVHGSTEKSFLKKPFSSTDHALCEQCHKKGLANDAYTTEETNFRNGNKNLHNFHLKRAGRTVACTTCHEVHASSQPGLIHPFMDFGEWKVPIQFAKTPTGGTCTTACHREKKYDRVQAITNEPGR